jgi:hypothetical protein
MHHTDGGSASAISGLPLRSASSTTIPFDVPTQSFILVPLPLLNRGFGVIDLTKDPVRANERPPARDPHFSVAC